MRICFVMLNAFPLFVQNTKSISVGGSETLQYSIGEKLAKMGYDVSFIVHKFDEYENFIPKDIKLFCISKNGEGLPLIRFFHPLMTSLYQCLKNINPDVCVTQSAWIGTSALAYYCKRESKKFVYWAGSIDDSNKTLKRRLNFRDVYLFEKGLKNADYIISQTQEQKENFKKYYNLDSKIIFNPIPSCLNDVKVVLNEQKISDKRYCLWLSNFRRIKRPEYFLKLAKNIPNLHFIMAGGVTQDKTYFDEIKRQADDIPNVDFLGFIDDKTKKSLFENAFLFINTSEREGFSNTYVESFVYGIPILTLKINPDQVLSTYNIGIECGDISSMVKEINNLSNDVDKYFQMRQNCLEYVNKKHSSKSVINSFLNLIEQ